MDSPKVSIVTPSYQQAPFLEETILSVLSQNYPNLEYWIMDGGSTDGSVEIIRKYQSSLASWVSQPDGGQANAINTGWQKSTGEIVAYLNADDRYTPGSIAKVVQTFQRFPEVGIAYGSCLFQLENRKQALYSPPDFEFHRLLLENYIPQPTVFIRRSVLEQVGLLDPSLRYCLDYDFWLRCALAGVTFRRMDGSPLAIFRIWPGSKTSNDSEGWVEERLNVLDRVFSSPSAAPALRRLKTYAQARSYVTVAYAISLNGDVRSARRFLERAWALNRLILRDVQFLRVGISTLLGSRATRYLRQMKWALQKG